MRPGHPHPKTLLARRPPVHAEASRPHGAGTQSPPHRRRHPKPISAPAPKAHLAACTARERRLRVCHTRTLDPGNRTFDSENRTLNGGGNRVYAPVGTLDRESAHSGALDDLLGPTWVHLIPGIVHSTRKHAECTQAGRIRVHPIAEFAHSISGLVHSIPDWVHPIPEIVHWTRRPVECTRPAWSRAASEYTGLRAGYIGLLNSYIRFRKSYTRREIALSVRVVE